MNSKIEIQHLLPDPSFICFVIPALFKKSECERLLSSNVKNSFQKAISNYPVYYRNNERLVVDDQELSDYLFQKVKPYLPQTIEIRSDIQSENGHWTLSALNSRLRFCKYSANQYFHRHLDGIYYQSETKQSKLTFMIYLNSAADFEGGRTLFYKTKESTETCAEYFPRQGDLIVFDHNVWHEGEVLMSGEKFVLRSDIIYSKNDVHKSSLPFEAHLGYIWKIKMFDENTILSGGRDKVINVWNKEGALIESLHEHANSIFCIEKINEQVFISGSRDKQIKVWKRKNNTHFELQRTISIHSAVVLTLCRLSENSFASGSGDNTIKVSNLEGVVAQTLTGHTGWVWQLITLNNFFIVSCSEDNTVKIWDYCKGTVINTFSDDCTTICLSYDAATNRLAGGTLQGEIVIRELADDFSEIRTRRIKAHNGIIRTIINLNGSLIASGGEDNLVKIWNIESGECITTLTHHNFVQSLELINENTLLSSSYDGKISMWQI